MSKANFLMIFVVLSGMVIVSSLTVGLLTGMLWSYILALWLFMLLLLIGIAFHVRTYRRLVTRVGSAKEQITEMQILQEKRYEQLAKRLDNLRPQVHSQQQVTTSAGSSGQLSELGYLIARAERAERRILGRLENIILDNDTHFRVVEELASNFDNRQKSE